MSLFKRGTYGTSRFAGRAEELQDLPSAGSQKVEAPVAITGRRSVAVEQKVPTLAGFSNRFFDWLESSPADRPPKPPTRRCYLVGWQLLESASIAGMKLDHITVDHALTIEGSSAANTNNALRKLRRMLKGARGQVLSVVPVVKLMEEQERDS
jgi:hypothetical protein